MFANPSVQIIDLCFTMPHSYVTHETPVPLEVLEDSCTLRDTKSGASFGVLDHKSRKILEVLQKEITIQIYADLSPVNPQRNNTKSGSGKKARRLNQPMALYVILYGAKALFESVGLFAIKCNLFLQHPRYCNKNVPYQNPHCLSPQEGKDAYTYDLNNSLCMDDNLDLELFANPIDLFANVAEQEALVGTDSPRALKTMLYNHQMQALTFMIQKEGGWAMDGDHKDMWKKQKDAFGRTVYFNTITGQKQSRPPQQFRGGLLIDAPGLGKSLSIIALIAADCERIVQDDCQGTSLSTTLLIIPKTCKSWTRNATLAKTK